MQVKMFLRTYLSDAITPPDLVSYTLYSTFINILSLKQAISVHMLPVAYGSLCTKCHAGITGTHVIIKSSLSQTKAFNTIHLQLFWMF